MPNLKKDIDYVYSGIERDIERQILDGVLKADECILSENELSRRYGVSRRSSRKALENLVNRGLLYRLPGKGTFVSRRPDTASAGKLAVSFVVPDIDDIFISEIGKAVQESATGVCNLLIQTSNGLVATENSNIEFLLDIHVDGAIIFPNWGCANIDSLYKLRKAGIPFVLIDRYLQDIDSDYVIVDNRAGGRLATEHLIRLGHRRIAHLHGTLGSANSDRFEGYRDALASAEIVFNPDYVKYIDLKSHGIRSERFEPDKRGGYENMKTLLSLPNPPSAVFAGNDFQAMGAIQAIRESGLRVPEDIAVVGFDDLKVASYFEVPLTTVRQEKGEIGRLAFELLLKRIRSPQPAELEHIVLPVRLVVRESCGGK